MAAVEWIWLIFVFAFGACMGSFLNVVIYRLPREKSLVRPPSACPNCETPIRFYNNIPMLSWILLRGKCPDCGAPISFRYFFVELLTMLLFGGIYLWVFWFQGRHIDWWMRGDIPPTWYFFRCGGWLYYVVIMTLVAGFLAASMIDLELFIIPLSLCWFITLVGFAGASAAEFVVFGNTTGLFPNASGSPTASAVALGAGIGLLVSLVCLLTGLIKPSYDMAEQEDSDDDQNLMHDEPEFNDRLEILKEIVFLAPVIIGAVLAWQITRLPSLADRWADFIEMPVVSGLLGSLTGYLAGCSVVWATRILGTLAFNKEAMGLGDVHLMGAAGAIIGVKWVVLAFFLAPFFGILWALYQALFKKMRQIPYGPFLSLAVFAVIIFHDWIQNFLTKMYGF